MKKFQSKIAPVFIVTILAAGMLVPRFHAQNLGNTVVVQPVPDGGYFSVDGQVYNHPMSAIWPAGSKHVLSVDGGVQDGGWTKTRFSFKGWSYANMVAPGGNTIIVVADPAVTSYTAAFDLQYALTLNYFSCPDPVNCDSPGKIYVGGAPYGQTQDVWLSANSHVVLTPVPNTGWVFDSWQPGPNQSILGAQNTVTMNGPVAVYPVFRQAKKINLTAAPPGLTLLADRTKVPTPTILEWGFGTSHTLGVISPQQDLSNKWWVFQSWSDGGASTHAYQVRPTQDAESVTANYVAGASALLSTVPTGLSLSIDGRTNWPSYGFVWGVGETHHIEAPAQQTDSQGRVWAFSSWSNGGPAKQDIGVPDIAVDNGIHLQATYKALGHLTVNTSLSTLTVQVNGKDCATPCDFIGDVGSTVTLSAPAAIPVADGIRADFLGWPGSGSTASTWTLTLTETPVNLVAGYHMMNRLAASSTPPDGATMTLSPSSSDGFYDAQTVVSVSVSPLPGYKFRAWSGDLAGTKPAGAVAMNSPRAIQAQLDRQPYIAPTGLSNAAGDTPQKGIAAGSVASIYGASFATDTLVGPASPLVQTLGGVTIRVDDRFLPLFFVSTNQINVQVPDDLPAGAQRLTVSSDGLPDVQADFNVVRNAPGLFGVPAKDLIYAMAVHEDGTAITADSPAQPGELITIYGTGFGPTDHPRPFGFAIPKTPDYLLVDGATVLVGDAILSAEKAFAVAGRIGIDAVQFRLDSTAPTATSALLHLTINGQDSNTVLLPIQ